MTTKWTMYYIQYRTHKFGCMDWVNIKQYTTKEEALEEKRKMQEFDGLFHEYRVIETSVVNEVVG